MNLYILDACALVALLQDEPGADMVAAVFNAANNGEAKIIIVDSYYSHLKHHIQRY